jgi:predicted transcriptional regulator
MGFARQQNQTAKVKNLAALRKYLNFGWHLKLSIFANHGQVPFLKLEVIFLLEKIKKLCKERGISINDLEKACGIGRNTIYKWGESSPTVDNLKAVAEFFGRTVDDLLKEE